MNRSPSSGPSLPALVLGSGITTLGVVRCLGRGGILPYCASVDPGLAASSRWARRNGSRLPAGAPLEPFLRGLPDPAVLFACTDAYALASASLPDDLKERFPASRAPRRALEILVDKRKTAETMARLGLPHPRSRVLRVPADLDAVPDEDLPGAFLKPVDSKTFFARYRAKGWSIAGREEARERLATAAGDGFELLLQEYVPGPPTHHVFVDGFRDRTGRVTARFARRRLRMHPPRYGNSSAMVSIPLVEVAPAVEALETLLSDLAYRGIFSAEFKWDARQGVFKLLEVNARPWWYVEFAARCGVDVCGMAYADALDRPVETVRDYPAGVLCVNTRADLSATWRMVRAGEMGPAEAIRALLRGQRVLFHPDDPLPAVRDFFQGVVKAVRGGGD